MRNKNLPSDTEHIKNCRRPINQFLNRALANRTSGIRLSTFKHRRTSHPPLVPYNHTREFALWHWPVVVQGPGLAHVVGGGVVDGRWECPLLESECWQVEFDSFAIILLQISFKCHYNFFFSSYHPSYIEGVYDDVTQTQRERERLIPRHGVKSFSLACWVYLMDLTLFHLNQTWCPSTSSSSSSLLNLIVVCRIL